MHKLGFPDVILPGKPHPLHEEVGLLGNMSRPAGDARNDIYVTLEGGSFSKGSKTAERNVEVAINVVDSAGKVIPVGLTV